MDSIKNKSLPDPKLKGLDPGIGILKIVMAKANMNNEIWCKNKNLYDVKMCE